MGLLSFAKNIGDKLFDRDDEAPAAIKQRIEQDNPGIENLEVSIDDGVVTLNGKAKDRAALEKAILIAGNVNGVEQVKDDQVEVLDQSAVTQNVEFYEIESGDTLSGIAQKFYGNPSKYQEIFEANREVIRDPNKIYPGQKIRIPKDA